MSETSFFQCVKNIVKDRKYQTLKMTLNYPSTMLWEKCWCCHLTGSFLHVQVTHGKWYSDPLWGPNLADKTALGGNKQVNKRNRSVV